MENNSNNGDLVVELQSGSENLRKGVCSEEEPIQRKISSDIESKCPIGDNREEEEDDIIKSERQVKLNTMPSRPFSETESETAYGSMDDEASQEICSSVDGPRSADLNSNEIDTGQSMPNSNTVDSMSPSTDFTSGGEECDEDLRQEVDSIKEKIPEENSSLNDMMETPRIERKTEMNEREGINNGSLENGHLSTNHTSEAIEAENEIEKKSMNKLESSPKRQLGADGLHSSLPDLQSITNKEKIDDGESSDEDPIISKTVRKDESLAMKKQKFNTLPRAAGRDEAKLNRMSALARMMQIINDDDKFPDSVTPTKVEHFSDAKDYDVPFIDDDAFYVEDWYVNEDNRWSFVDPSDNYGTQTARASEDMVNGSLTEEIVSSKKGSPLRSRPPTNKKKGLFGLCGCFSSQPH